MIAVLTEWCVVQQAAVGGPEVRHLHRAVGFDDELEVMTADLVVRQRQAVALAANQPSARLQIDAEAGLGAGCDLDAGG